MTFDGGAVSDDEDNSWEDSVSDSDGSAGRDDYYDQEDYDEESPSPLPKNLLDRLLRHLLVDCRAPALRTGASSRIAWHLQLRSWLPGDGDDLAQTFG